MEEGNKEENGFEPTIVGFCCNWCSYAAADLAGISRLKYPPNIRIIRVPCTGKVDPLYILKAFELGADGVFIAGCLEGECHYLTGNLYARDRVKRLKSELEKIGLGDRLEMFFASAAMGKEFAGATTNLTDKIKKLGPNPLKPLERRNEP
jgi:F420-non-reducing hydrogenase iron-sulfur subunit